METAAGGRICGSCGHYVKEHDFMGCTICRCQVDRTKE